MRAGNAMGRTRSGVLEAAAEVVAERGTKRASMTDIAAAAGIAKGTLYNHFRTKDDVWSALAEAEVQRLASECRDLPLASALRYAAERIAAHPVARRLAEDEPAMLAALLIAGPSTPGWTAAREAVAALLTRSGADPAATDLVLRWLASHLVLAEPLRAEVTARLLAAALPAAPEVLAEVPDSAPAAAPVTVPAAAPARAPAAAAGGERDADAHELWAGMRAPARQPEGTVAPGSGQRDGMGPGAAHASAWQGLAGVRPVTENPGFLPFI